MLMKTTSSQETHKPVDVLRHDAQRGELARQGREGLVTGVGRLPREAHGKVLEEELVVPPEGVAAEDGAPALGGGCDAPDRVASASERRDACCRGWWWGGGGGCCVVVVVVVAMHVWSS